VEKKGKSLIGLAPKDTALSSQNGQLGKLKIFDMKLWQNYKTFLCHNLHFCLQS
jgi:hypothetical protein